MHLPRTSLTLLVLSVLCLLALGVLSCGGDSGPRTGERLWNDLGCINCHGPDGRGMPGFGPTLHGKKSNWTHDTLLAYLRDPVGYAAKDPRLKKQAQQFMSPMPPVLTPDPVEVDRIIERVLAMP
jgi:mono/diheme cytochrome c family protein